MTRRVRRPLAIAAAWCAGGALAATISGCGACDTPTGCSTAPAISYSGQFVEHTTGRPVGGVRVQLVRTSGVTLENDTVTALTDAQGFYRLRALPTTEGELVGDVVVTPPAPNRPYRVPGVTFDTRTVRGDGGVLGRWVVDPYIQFIGELRRLSTSDFIRGASLVFRRTGGAALDVDSIVRTTDAFGRFELRPRLLSFGDVLGTITVAPGPASPRVIEFPVRLVPIYRDDPPTVGGSFRLGPSFRYLGQVVERGTNRLLPNVQVTFERTGGATASPSRFTAVTDENGLFPILLDAPASYDDVVGDFTFRVPGVAQTYVERGVRIAVFDADEVRLLRTFVVGPPAITSRTARVAP